MPCGRFRPVRGSNRARHPAPPWPLRCVLDHAPGPRALVEGPALLMDRAGVGPVVDGQSRVATVEPADAAGRVPPGGLALAQATAPHRVHRLTPPSDVIRLATRPERRANAAEDRPGSGFGLLGRGTTGP